MTSSPDDFPFDDSLDLGEDPDSCSADLVTVPEQHDIYYDSRATQVPEAAVETEEPEDNLFTMQQVSEDGTEPREQIVELDSEGDPMRYFKINGEVINSNPILANAKRGSSFLGSLRELGGSEANEVDKDGNPTPNAIAAQEAEKAAEKKAKRNRRVGRRALGGR